NPLYQRKSRYITVTTAGVTRRVPLGQAVCVGRAQLITPRPLSIEMDMDSFLSYTEDLTERCHRVLQGHMRYKGKVTRRKSGQGFGFITPYGGGERIFVHIKA